MKWVSIAMFLAACSGGASVVDAGLFDAASFPFCGARESDVIDAGRCVQQVVLRSECDGGVLVRLLRDNWEGTCVFVDGGIVGASAQGDIGPREKFGTWTLDGCGEAVQVCR